MAIDFRPPKANKEKTLGEKLREWREKQIPPLSQEDVAKKINVSVATINRIENHSHKYHRIIVESIKYLINSN